MNIFSRRISPEQTRHALSEAIHAGGLLLNGNDGNLSDSAFYTWYEYARNCIQRAFGKDYHNVEANFLYLNIIFLSNNVAACEKLKHCLKFLTDLIEAV